MKELTINFLLNAVVSYILATLAFLIGAELGDPSVITAAIAGVLGGTGIAVSYQIGRMVGHLTFDYKALLVQIGAAVIFGLLGGLQMGL